MEAEVARQTSSVLTCDMCDGAAVADVGCTECQKRLCASCRQVHDQVAGAASHSLTPLVQDTTTEKASTKLKSYRGGSSRRNTCKIHGQEVILFCIQCNVTLCRQCQNTSHGGHVTEQLTAVMEKQRAEMRSLLQEIQKRVKAEEEVIQKTNKEEQELERQKQEMVGQAVEAAGKVTAWANQAEDKVVAQINDASAPIRTKLLTLKNAALERKTALDQLRDRARLAMQSGCLGELKSLTQQMKKVLSTQAVSSQPEHEGSGPKQTQFFRWQSSCQELLQNAVPRFIGEVIPVGGGQPNTQVENRKNAWVFRVGTALNESLSGLRTTATGLQSIICRQDYYTLQQYYTVTYTIADSPADPIHNQGNYAFGRCYKIQGTTSFPSTELLLLADGAFYTGPDFGNVVQATVRGPSLPSQSALLSRDAMASDRRVYMLDSKKPLYEIQELTLTPPATVTAQPLFQIVHASQPQAFDASSDGKYFAVLTHCNRYYCSVDAVTGVKNLVQVSIFRRMQAEPCAVFWSPEPGCNRDKVNGDLCFSKYHGKEVLRVAVYEDDTIYALDYENGCAVVGRTPIYQPRYIRADAAERVWVVSDYHVVAFNTSP